MTKSQIWNFIKKNLVTFVTLITGVTSIILMRVKVLNFEDIIQITLALITLLVTSELVSKSQKLEEIEELIKQKHSDLVKELSGVKVLHFRSSNEAYEFMSDRILDSKTTIFHFAMANAVPLASYEKNRFEKSILKSLKQNKIRYNYLAKLPNERREKRINGILNDEGIKTFFTKYIDIELEVFHNFMVFDKETVIVNFPYEYGQDESFVFVQHPLVVQFYISYFNHVWNIAKPYSQNSFKA